MSTKGQKIMAKHPGHLPCVCFSPGATSKRKLLVPAQMGMADFLTIAVKHCSWADAGSELQLGGEAVVEIGTVAGLYNKHKNADDMLHVIVANAGTAKQQGTDPAPKTTVESGSEVGHSTAETGSQVEHSTMDSGSQASQTTSDSSSQVEQSIAESGSQVEHSTAGFASQAEQPKEDAGIQTPEAATGLRRLLLNNPTSVPVIVRQGPLGDLPAFDRKMLVPRNITCGHLAEILPKHLKVSKDDGIQLFAGDMLLAKDAVMSDVYTQCKDQEDGGLYITVKKVAPAPVQEQKIEGLVENQVEDEVKEYAAPPQARPIVAEDEMAVLRWKLQDMEKQLHLERADAAKMARLFESAGARAKVAEDNAAIMANKLATAEKAKEALKAEHAKAIEDACRSLSKMTQQLVAQAAEKAEVEVNNQRLMQRMQVWEEADAKRNAKEATAKALEEDGFILVGGDSS